MSDNTEREWTDDAELLTQALEAGGGAWQQPDENDVVIDGTYDATAVLNFIRAAAWDEGFERGEQQQDMPTMKADAANRINPYR